MEDVIKWVNTQKQNNGSIQPNVVMGISMGGLVARYALRHLEIQGYLHQTKIFFSVDSPHNGANTPVGVQAAVNFLQDYNSLIGFSSDLTHAYNLLNTTAAKQMLFYKVSDGNVYDNYTHQSFLTDIRNMGFPVNCYSIGISDGSGSNATLFDPGSILFDYTITYNSIFLQLLFTNLSPWLLSPSLKSLLSSIIPGKSDLRVEFAINAIPTSPGSVLHARIYTHKKVLWLINVNSDILNEGLNSTNEMYPIDGVSGGIYSTDAFLTLSPELDNNLKKKQFCFVPAVSALASNDWSSNLNSNPNVYGLNNFQDYYNQMPALNNLHTSFYTSDYSLANYIKTKLDNIESYCTSVTTIQNVNYTKSQTITGCNLTIQNVSIQNSSTVIFDPIYNTTINGPFEIQLGSSIEIK